MKFILFFGIGFLILYLVFSNQQEAYTRECVLKGVNESQCSLFTKIINDFSNAKIIWLLASVTMFLISNVLRALRWNLMLESLGYRPKLVNTLGATLIGYLLNLTLPRAGEIAKPATVSKYEKIPLDHTIGTIVTDRIFDVICLAIVMAIGLLLASGDIWAYLSGPVQAKLDMLRANASILYGAIILSLAIISALYLMRKTITSHPLVIKALGFLNGVWQGVMSVSKLEKRWAFLGYTVGIWILYYAMTYVVFWAFEPTAHLGPIVGLVVFIFGSLGIVIPSPGGMGSYHFLVSEALTLYGVQGADAFSFANLIFFAIQIFGNILFGGLSLLLLPWYNKSK